MKSSKEIKFMFKDSDKNDLVGFDFIIPIGTTWLEMDKLFDKEISKFTGKENNCVSPDMDRWMKDKKFPDGTHYFINFNNDWGFISAYLYRVA